MYPTVQATMVPTGSLQCTMSSGVRDSDSMSTFASECTEAERAAKKQKVSFPTSLLSFAEVQFLQLCSCSLSFFGVVVAIAQRMLHAVVGCVLFPAFVCLS